METASGIRTATHRIGQAKYRSLSSRFVDELFELVVSRRSVAILGPRGVGKQHAIEEVTKRLDATDGLAVHLRCDGIESVRAEQAVCHQLNGRLSLPATNSVEICLENLEEKLESETLHLTLIVSDADLLPHAVTRRLLTGIRRLTQHSHSQIGSCAVILTGSLELSPLLHGVDSEFNSDVHFVVQSYEPQLFRDLVRKTFSSYQATEQAIDRIAELTGRNLVMLQQFCVVLTDLQRRTPDVLHQLDESVVSRVVEELSKSGFGHSHVQLTAFTRIENSATALRQLEMLITGSDCVIDTAAADGDSLRNAPTELELSGIAVRNGTTLTWQSPLMEILARQYFSWWSVGDAYASCDKWHDALRCYQAADNQGHPWIQNPTRRPRLNAALRAFETHLHRLAGESKNPVSSLLQFFEESSPFVLGFDEVRRYVRSPDGKSWISRHGAAAGRYEIYLPDSPDSAGQCGLTGFTESAPKNDAPFGRLIRLSSVPMEHDFVLLASCLESRSPITSARESQIRPVVRSLLQAFDHACRQEHNQSQTRRQEQLLAALPRVFQIVSPRATNVTMDALQQAGDNLRKQGYRRVMFSLVDKHASEIRGVLDCREAGEPDVAIKSHVLLPRGTDPNFVVTDVQQECVISKKHVILHDAATHPLSCEPNINAGMKAVLILPLISSFGGDVLGTMHVERVDREPLSDAERESLEYFARQLAEAIHAAIMLDLLEGSVRDQPDAIVLLDAEGEIAFVNSKASALLGEPAGWRDGKNVQFKKTENVFKSQIRNVIKKADQLRERFSGYFDFGGKTENKLHVVSAQPLSDWRNLQVGMLVQISDIRNVSQLWREIRELGAATDLDSLNETVLRIFKDRGHSWGRVYLIDPNEELLRGTAQFGFDNRIDDGKNGILDFETGRAVLRGQSKFPTAWICLRDNELKLFEAVSENSDLLGQQPSSMALPIVYATEDSHVPVYSRKNVGDRWIELPLTQKIEIRRWVGMGSVLESKTQFLGKISVSCPADMTLEQFEQLRILAEALSSSYAAMNERLRRQRADEEKKREAMEKAIGETCHRLQSGIAALEVVMQLVQDAGDDELRQQWVNGRTRLQKILEDATSRLRAFRIEQRQVDLVEFLQSFLSTSFEPGQYCLSLPGDAIGSKFLADIDTSKFQEALEELVANSRKATRHAATPLRIEMTLDLVPDACGTEETCRIVYKDNGPGISADCRTKIFEEWYSHWDDASSRGSGMGMNHVRRILRAHGGTITCEPSETGACFVLKFPRWADAMSDAVLVDGVREDSQ